MMSEERQIVSIHGVPRSGTSWLGQIFNSHPDVAYRHQPLFAYRFKDRLHPGSSKCDIYRFLKELYDTTEDDFILDKREAYKSILLPLQKNRNPNFLVMKMVRYHHLIEKFIKEIDGVKIIGIVRNPCAVINSWLQAPKEFRDGWDPIEEWRYAPRKNLGRIEEYNGFEKWKEVAWMFLKLEEKYRQEFCLVKYDDLVENPVSETASLFNFVGLEMHAQVSNFINISRKKHSEDPYSVFKNPRVKERWRSELDPLIVNQIMIDVENTELERFLQ